MGCLVPLRGDPLIGCRLSFLSGKPERLIVKTTQVFGTVASLFSAGAPGVNRMPVAMVRCELIDEMDGYPRLAIVELGCRVRMFGACLAPLARQTPHPRTA